MFGDDRDTIYKTTYKDGEGTEALTNYMAHDGQQVRDRTGRAMSDDEIERFNEKAAGKRNRHIVISPERDREQFTEAELDRATRDYMSGVVEDRPTADYVYSVHDDKAEEHGKDVHIAMTADDRTDLEMYPNDIKRERERAHETYREHQNERQQQREQQQQMEREQERKQRLEQERDQENDRGIGR